MLAPNSRQQRAASARLHGLLSFGNPLHFAMDVAAAENEQRQHGESQRNGGNCEIEYGSHDS
jgi:hypothetical protein